MPKIKTFEIIEEIENRGTPQRPYLIPSYALFEHIAGKAEGTTAHIPLGTWYGALDVFAWLVLRTRGESYDLPVPEEGRWTLAPFAP